MRHFDEYHHGGLAGGIVRELRRIATRPWTLMEVCDGEAHSTAPHSLAGVLPAGVELVHGPGCPASVTPPAWIDEAHRIARRPDAILAALGDSAAHLPRPGSEGADVRIVTTPLDAVRIALRHSGRQVVFFGIGFETTAPATALAVERARELGLANFSVLVSQRLVPPAIRSVLRSPGARVRGFLGPGRACALAGTRAYEAIARDHQAPVVVTGSEPAERLDGVLRAVRLLERGEALVESRCGRPLSRDGHREAQRLVARVFEVCDREWQGLGTVPGSALRLRAEYRAFDAERRFGVDQPAPHEADDSSAARAAVGSAVSSPR